MRVIYGSIQLFLAQHLSAMLHWPFTRFLCFHEILKMVDNLNLLFSECNSRGYCSFPAFLWEPVSPTPTASGNDTITKSRLWISRTEYLQNTNTWEKQKEIRVSQTEIYIQHKLYAHCDGYQPDESVPPCFRRNNKYHIICVSEEPNGKFRVMQESNG